MSLDIAKLREIAQEAQRREDERRHHVTVMGISAVTQRISQKAAEGEFQVQFDVIPARFLKMNLLDEFLHKLASEGFEVTDYRDAEEPFVSVYWGLNARPGVHSEKTIKAKANDVAVKPKGIAAKLRNWFSRLVMWQPDNITSHD